MPKSIRDKSVVRPRPSLGIDFVSMVSNMWLCLQERCHVPEHKGWNHRQLLPPAPGFWWRGGGLWGLWVCWFSLILCITQYCYRYRVILLCCRVSKYGATATKRMGRITIRPSRANPPVSRIPETLPPLCGRRQILTFFS